MTETALTREEIRVSCSASRRRLAVVMQTVADRWTWERSRASGTALIPYGACSDYWPSRGADRVADEKRAWAAAYDFANGYDTALRKFVELLHLDAVLGVRPNQVADEIGPSYHELRWYLEGEIECDRRVAMRIAFSFVVRRNAWRRRRAEWTAQETGRTFLEPAEIGWL